MADEYTPEDVERALQQAKDAFDALMEDALFFGLASTLASDAMESFNCRCVILMIELPWQVDIVDNLDLEFGDTDPSLVEYKE